MQPLSLSTVSDSGLTVYRYLAGDTPLVERHWQGLYHGDWSNAWEEVRATPWTKFAVSNANAEEVAVYLGLAWRLTEGFSRYVIPVYCRDEATAGLKRGFELVDWEYDIDASERDWRHRDNGFVAARASVPAAARAFRMDAPHREAGLFDVVAFSDLAAAVRATLMDHWGEVTLLAVPQGQVRRDDLVASLRGRNPPEITDVVGNDGILIDLTIGVDVGYYDSLLVATALPVTSAVDALVADYAQRIASYEARVDDITDMAEWLSAAQALSGLE